MTRPCIVVTRPEPGASATARRLEAAGFDAIVLPLTEIRDLAVKPDPALADSDAVLATSVNAIRHAPAKMLAMLANKPCFTVGEETARAAQDTGFAYVAVGEGDAAALARLVIEKTGEGARLAYLTGRVRRDGLERKLAESGRQVVVTETYDTVPVIHSQSKLAEILADRFDGVLLYSGQAGEILVRLPDAERHFGKALLFGLSERIGSALPQRWRERFRAAGTPDEAALFKVLEAAFPPMP